jgi:hypothetical protein
MTLTHPVIGRNWLLHAQKPLENIHRAEHGSSSSSAGSTCAPIGHEALTAQAFAQAEQVLQTADYVEARGILLPAIEYLGRAVDIARAQGSVTGILLATVCLYHMSYFFL